MAYSKEETIRGQMQQHRDKEILELRSELTAAKAENEALRGRVAELESEATEKRIDALNSAFILRKQAEAVGDFGNIFDRMHQMVASRKVAEDAFEYAQRLSQQAEAAEKGCDDD